MALRPPARTVTAAACTLIAAGGLSACHHRAAPPRAAGRPSASSTPGRKRHRPAGHPAPTKAARTTPPPAAHHTSEPPLPPVISHIPVKDKLVFITVDDGWEKDPSFVKLVRERRIPLTLFLTNDAIKKDYGYFRGLQGAGALIEDHTMTHAYLPKLSFARQKHEICDPADIYAREYGKRPTLFRAPYGATRRTTLRAARDCGMKAVFFWREVVTNGKIDYQLPGKLHRGDILLVHFNPHMTRDFKKLLSTVKKQGFTPAAVRAHLPAADFA